MTSTRFCPACGSENLALMRTLDLKYCCCGQWMPWRLEPGQAPVGYAVPPTKKTEESKDDQA
jgi:hypothetical protein